MTSDSKATRQIVERFHNAFEKHRPEDLDDLIGDGCVLEIRRRPRMERAMKDARLASPSGRESRRPPTLSSKLRKSP
jgi:hypothetical protein